MGSPIAKNARKIRDVVKHKIAKEQIKNKPFKTRQNVFLHIKLL
jgi:hypothetical protein